MSGAAASAPPLSFPHTAVQSQSQLRNRLLLHRTECVIAAVAALQDDSVVRVKSTGAQGAHHAHHHSAHLADGEARRHKYSLFSLLVRASRRSFKIKGVCCNSCCLLPSTGLTHLPSLPAQGGVALALWRPLSCTGLSVGDTVLSGGQAARM